MKNAISIKSWIKWSSFHVHPNRCWRTSFKNNHYKVSRSPIDSVPEPDGVMSQRRKAACYCVSSDDFVPPNLPPSAPLQLTTVSQARGMTQGEFCSSRSVNRPLSAASYSSQFQEWVTICQPAGAHVNQKDEWVLQGWPLGTSRHNQPTVWNQSLVSTLWFHLILILRLSLFLLRQRLLLHCITTD